MKEMNHRFGFYLVSALVIVMLIFIYLDVRMLHKDVDALLQSADSGIVFDPMMIQEMQDQAAENEAADMNDDSEELTESDVDMSVDEDSSAEEATEDTGFEAGVEFGV
tara:strand:+ start:29 stop:352 length:324 start_codon:yes stop_codon:yes gene_type:complete